MPPKRMKQAYSTTEIVDEHAVDILRRENIKHHIVNEAVHEHFPYIKSFGQNDEIRITIMNKDAVLLPCESSLVIAGSAVKKDTADRTNCELINNAFAFLFSEIRYEINNVIVDVVRNPGITSTMKNVCFLSPAERRSFGNACWTEDLKLYESGKCNTEFMLSKTGGKFYGIVPLRLWMGFFEDHTRVMTGVKHDLVLIRGRHDNRCLTTTAESPNETTITVTDVIWRMPHLTLSDAASLAVTRVLDSRRPIPMQFRRWEIHEYPNVPSGGKGPFQWTVKTAAKEDNPLYIFFGMQTGKDANLKQNSGEFDGNDMTRAKLYLNDEFYPYSELLCNVKFYTSDTEKWQPYLYEMMQKAERSYYNRNPISNMEYWYVNSWFPIIVWDVSSRESAVLPSQTDIKITWETGTAMPANVTAYCLIIYKTEVLYAPIDDFVVKKNVMV